MVARCRVLPNSGPVPVYALSLALMQLRTEIFGAIDSSIPLIYFQF